MDIKSHSQARSKGGEGGRPLLQFLKIKESVLMLKRKALMCLSLGQIFHSKEKNLQNISLRDFSFSCVFDEMFIEVP